MKIVATLGDILENGSWDAFCEMKGMDPWCVNEGLAASDETVELSVQEAQDLGLIFVDIR